MLFLVDSPSITHHVLYSSSYAPLLSSLSTVISNSAANHHLYTDDTQLLVSFSALDLSHNITHLVNTITNVYWMSSNFLVYNPSKTEFLIFGLTQQLFKLNNPTIHLPNNVILSPVDSARNLGVIFDKISHLFNKSLHFLNLAFTIDEFVILLIKLLLAPLLLLSFTLKLTIVTLFY